MGDRARSSPQTTVGALPLACTPMAVGPPPTGVCLVWMPLMKVWLGHTGAQLEGSLNVCQVGKASDWSRDEFSPIKLL